MPNKKGYCPDCGCRVFDPLPQQSDFFALCYDCGLKLMKKQERAASMIVTQVGTINGTRTED